MALEVTLYEPTLPDHVARQGEMRGYVGLADPNGVIKFPHVDTCCAVAFVLESGHLIGGHVPLKWSESDPGTVIGNLNKVVGLMDVIRKNHAKDGHVTAFFGFGDHNTWRGVVGAIYTSKFDPDMDFSFPFLFVNNETANGANVDFRAASVEIQDFKQQGIKKTFKFPPQGVDYGQEFGQGL